MQPLNAKQSATRIIVDDTNAFRALIHTNKEDDAKSNNGALLALDFGLKRIGIAVSTSQRNIAVALPILQRQNQAEDLLFLRKLFAERSCKAWVLGLPLSQSGKESAMSLEVRRFAIKLIASQNPQAPLLLFDERFTSALIQRIRGNAIGMEMDRKAIKSARMTRKTKKKIAIDSAVATLLLQNCLCALKSTPIM